VRYQRHLFCVGIRYTIRPAICLCQCQCDSRFKKKEEIKNLVRDCYSERCRSRKMKPESRTSITSRKSADANSFEMKGSDGHPWMVLRRSYEADVNKICSNKGRGHLVQVAGADIGVEKMRVGSCIHPKWRRGFGCGGREVIP
jgi:hypothetical protein